MSIAVFFIVQIKTIQRATLLRLYVMIGHVIKEKRYETGGKITDKVVLRISFYFLFFVIFINGFCSNIVAKRLVKAEKSFFVNATKYMR